jgi:CheY-like chemotaxis protein
MTKPLALIVEDERDVALYFSMALQDAGFETEIVSSGDAALRLMADIVPQMVILDLYLPRMGGAEVLRRIRADERLAETRVIIASADARAAEFLQGMADLILVKPVSLNQLRDLAARLGLRGTEPKERSS